MILFTKARCSFFHSRETVLRTISIAGTSLYLSGDDFYTYLRDAERRFLEPFGLPLTQVANTHPLPWHVVFFIVSPDNRHINSRFAYAIRELHERFPVHFNNAFFITSEAFFHRHFALDTSFRQIFLTSGSRGLRTFSGSINSIGSFSLFLFSPINRTCAAFIATKPGSDLVSWRYRLNMLKHILAGMLCVEKNGILLHAASVVLNGKGYVFMGPSGSGKTTVATLLAGKCIFSDDCSIIRKSACGYDLFPTPWWSYRSAATLNRPFEQAPLTALFFLKRARKTSLRKVAPLDAIARIVKSDWPFRGRLLYEHKTVVRHFFMFAHRLFYSVPVFELQFTKSDQFRQTFLNLISHHILEAPRGISSHRCFT